MHRPNRNDPTKLWSLWADAHHAYDGSSPRGLSGFDLLRSVEDPVLRGDMARALCEANPEPYQGNARPAGVPPIPAQPLFGDEEGIEE